MTRWPNLALVVLCVLVFGCWVMAEEGGGAPAYLNAATAEPGWKPLVIELPEPLFVGTPQDIWTPNLEPITGKKRLPFLAPEGTVNLALKKPVTGSAPEVMIGALAQITDGDRRGSDGSFVELPAGTQYVQIDLGAVREIRAIVFWHYHLEARVYFDVVVRAADDPDFIMNVQTLFNNDHDNSSGLGVGKDKEYIDTNEGKLVDVGGKRARYIRLYSRGNTSNELNHYIEVEVYGKGD